MNLILGKQYILCILHMPADALATLGAKVSASVVLTRQMRNISLPTLEEFM